VPVVEREDGVRLFWEDWGDGPGLLVIPSYIQHPTVLKGLLAELQSGHRTIRYDARGAGESTRRGPYDMQTDVADLIAVLEAAGPVAAVLANGDGTNRAVHAAARRPDLVPYVISLETVPLARGQAEGTESLIASSRVLGALVAMMRADYRTGLTAAVQRGNPEMSQDSVRDRVDAIVAYMDHEASLGRLEAWIADDPGDAPRALGNRLVVAYEGAGAWFPADLTELGRDVLPDAQIVKLDGGAVSRPDLAAAVVRGVTGVANASSGSPSPAREPRAAT
jgi:pimeloyl-ACP methyl ester carboxylesterase